MSGMGNGLMIACGARSIVDHIEKLLSKTGFRRLLGISDLLPRSNPMYPSDLSDEEWELLAPFFKRSDPRGNPGK